MPLNLPGKPLAEIGFLRGLAVAIPNQKQKIGGVADYHTVMHEH